VVKVVKAVKSQVRQRFSFTTTSWASGESGEIPGQTANHHFTTKSPLLSPLPKPRKRLSTRYFTTFTSFTTFDTYDTYDTDSQ
jgi:hypothetical protein